MVLLVVEPGCLFFFVVFRQTQTRQHVFIPLPPFCIVYLFALLCIELVFTDIRGDLGVSKWAGISYRQKNTEAFVKN